MTLRSSKTEWLLVKKLLLNIKGAYTYVSILPSSLYLIWLIIGMGTKLKNDFSENTIKNAWNQYDQMHCCQIWVLCLHTFSTNIWGLIISLFASYIYSFRSIAGIFHSDLIYKTIVTNLNFIIFPIFLPVTFFLYLKLSHISTSLLLNVCFLMNTILNMGIPLNFLKKILYETDKPKWLRKVIALTRALAKYRYIAVKRI